MSVHFDPEFDAFPAKQAAALEAVWRLACAALPGAEQCRAWGMPTLRIDGDLVLSLQGFRQHNSIFPGPGVVGQLASQFPNVDVTKGTIHFGKDTPMRAALVRSIIKARIAELNASYPRPSGEFKEFYPNGWLKARGRMKDGLMHGAWAWFRRDGTRKRSGHFRLGERTGEWITYDTSGEPYSHTYFDAGPSSR